MSSLDCLQVLSSGPMIAIANGSMNSYYIHCVADLTVILAACSPNLNHPYHGLAQQIY